MNRNCRKRKNQLQNFRPLIKMAPSTWVLMTIFITFLTGESMALNVTLNCTTEAFVLSVASLPNVGIEADISEGSCARNLTQVPTPPLDMAPIYFSDCGSFNTTNGTHIVFVNSIVLIEHQTRGIIVRKRSFKFNLQCIQMKNLTLQSDVAWQINNTLVPVKEELVEQTFALALSLDFYNSDSYATKHAATFDISHGENLYVGVSEVTDNPLFKFTVNQCWSAKSNLLNETTKDVFFDNMCPVDGTIEYADGQQASHSFNFKMMAYAFTADPNAELYIVCKVTVCNTEDNSQGCVQPSPSTCAGTKRKRRGISARSVDDSEDVEEMLLSSKQTFIVDNSELFWPQCADGFVFDRVAKECTNERTLIIKGVYLDEEWNPAYSNNQSDEFKRLNQEKSFQLYALQRTVGSLIRGVKVISARRGSVILDVMVTHEASASAVEAFREFERVVKEGSRNTARIVNILRLRQDKIIEYVPVANTHAQEEAASKDTEKLTLMVVVVVLVLVVLIAAVTLIKVWRGRGVPPAGSSGHGVINEGVSMEKIA